MLVRELVPLTFSQKQLGLPSLDLSEAPAPQETAMPVPQPDPQEYNATQGEPRAVGMRGRGCWDMQPSGIHLVLLRFP